MSSKGLSAPHSANFSFDQPDHGKKVGDELETIQLEFELAARRPKIAFERLDDFVVFANIDRLFAEVKGVKKQLDE